MNNIGVVEGFFGPQWNEEARLSYASFLKDAGGEFFIYAPKQDQYLRKLWREDYSPEYISKLTALKNHFHKHQIKFGIGFSPFALGMIVTAADKIILKEKIEAFNSMGIDILGLFFDDMPTNENLAPTQLEVLEIVTSTFKNKVIFCPTYYTPDPILEKVFGKKPDHYLDSIVDSAPTEVAIAWTGPKVISPEISDDHLRETATLLKRKPYIWENFFANDGPKNCKFLKLKPYSGRTDLSLPLSEGFAFNLMNQAELSKINFLAAKYVLADGLESTLAFKHAVEKLCSSQLKAVLEQNLEKFLTSGLDNISDEEKSKILTALAPLKDPMSTEIKNWLQGEYTVGSECLTD